MSLAILVPVLNRPHRVEPLLESIWTTVPDAETLFLLSPGDTAEREALAAAGAQCYRPAYIAPPTFAFEVDGNYAAKINAGLALTDADTLFLGADDLRFVEGWYEEAKTHLTDGIGVVGVNDLIPRQRDHTTHFLVTREYAQRGTIDEPDKLLHEGYQHEFVDDEFVATARHRGAYAYAPHAVVEHLHPMVGKAPVDSLYAGIAPRMRFGRKHFARRQHLWT